MNNNKMKHHKWNNQQDEYIWEELEQRNHQFAQLRVALGTIIAQTRFIKLNISEISLFIQQADKNNHVEESRCWDYPFVSPIFTLSADSVEQLCVFEWQFCVHYKQHIKQKMRAKCQSKLDQTCNEQVSIDWQSNEEHKLQQIIHKILRSTHNIVFLMGKSQMVFAEAEIIFVKMTRVLIAIYKERREEIIILQAIHLRQVFNDNCHNRDNAEWRSLCARLQRAKLIVIHGLGDEWYSVMWETFLFTHILFQYRRLIGSKIIILSHYNARQLLQQYTMNSHKTSSSGDAITRFLKRLLWTNRTITVHYSRSATNNLFFHNPKVISCNEYCP